MQRFQECMIAFFVGILTVSAALGTEVLAVKGSVEESTEAPAISRSILDIDRTSAQTSGCNLPVGHYDYCSVCGPCLESQGDCDSDSDCGEGLLCTTDVGPDYGFGLFVDVCATQTTCPLDAGHPDYCALCGPCEDGVGDCDSDDQCQEGLSCVPDSGSTYEWWWDIDVCVSLEEDCPVDEGDPDFCVLCGPCEAEQGDCDSDAECSADLTCVDNVGLDHGFFSYIDVCLDVVAGECPLSDGHPDYCTLCGPCEAEEGDCDGDQECQSGLLCINNTGAKYGFGKDTDVCIAPLSPDEVSENGCPVDLGHYDYCALCGPCEEGTGDCDLDAECADGLFCMNDVGDFYNWAEDVDVCRVSGDPECPEVLGEFGYCGICGPCQEGEGDCDTHDECAGDLLCVSDLGANYGWSPDTDVCQAECPVPLGHEDYCSICGPCEEGQGNCKSDSDCASNNLTCIEDSGAFFGLGDDVDVCVSGGTCTEPLGSYPYCSICGPCNEGEGDCDADNECAAGLVCTNEAGSDFGFAWDVDVCTIPEESECLALLGQDSYCEQCGPCAIGEGDCDSDSDCQEGLFCISNVGDNYGWDSTIDVCEEQVTGECTGVVGDFNFCAICGPCDLGEGDCDLDDECQIGLVCSSNVGADYGLDPSLDICEVNQDCPDLLGDNTYCSVCGPCGEGEGDCDGDAECADGLTCVNNIGANFGFPWEVDVCTSGGESCPVPVGHYDYCSICGPCLEGQGDCDSDTECQDGLTCAQDIGALYGFSTDVDVCQQQ